MKFIELVIGIIVILAIISFVTDCNGPNSNPFTILFTKFGVGSSDNSS